MARQFQLRGDTLAHWEEANPVLAEREMILVASNPYEPTVYDQYKVGDGIHRFSELKYKGLPAVQVRGYSLSDVMSQFAVTSELDKLEATQRGLVDLIEDIQKHLESGEPGHEQNTDTGTNSRSFRIFRVLLENCHSGLELRNEGDTDYEDLTLRNLYVKGRLYADHGITETEVEHVKTSSNLIVVNDGETGEGVTLGTAGIEVDRGRAAHYFVLWDEAAGCLKAGVADDLCRVALVGEVLEDGVGLVWDGERGCFVAGLDRRCMRKDRIRVADEFPGDEEDAPEDGDILIVPTDEELGTMEDLVDEFLCAVVKPIVDLIPSSYRKRGDADFMDGTIVVKVEADRAVGSDVVVLVNVGVDEPEWVELVVGKGKVVGEVTVLPRLAGQTVSLKLKNPVGDDVYIYSIRKDVKVIE